MADDEFDKLCRSFEDDIGSQVVGASAVGDNKDTSDIIDEIDSFLGESVEINSNIINDKEVSFESQTKSLDNSSSLLQQPLEDASVCPHKDANFPTSVPLLPASPTDPLARHWSEIAPSLANLPEDQARPVEQVLVRSDGLDLSLLDKEEWEDDWEIREFTMSDILSELKEHLLDESDDEEVAPDDLINEKSLVAEEKCLTDTRMNDSVSCTARSQKRNEFASLESRSRETEERYYRQLEDVWRKYAGQEGVGQMPTRMMMVRPRIYKDNGRVVGYESLQEYVDNNHPLWGAHRQVFKEVLFKEKEQGHLVRWVAKQWGDQRVNTARNLTVFNRGGGGDRGRGKGNNVVRDVERVGEVRGREGKMNIREARATLVDMYANSSNVEGVKETEEARWKLFEAALKTKLQEAEALSCEVDVDEAAECDLCGEVCLCMVGRKRKAGEEGGGGKVSKQQYLDSVLSSASRKGWTVDRTVEVVYGVEEAYELQSCYNNNPFLSKEQVSELASLEEVHSMITEMYDSPYKQDNQEEEGTWSSQLLEDY